MWDTMNTSSGGLVFILDTLLQSEEVDIFQQMRVHLITEKFSLWILYHRKRESWPLFCQQETRKRKPDFLRKELSNS